MGPKYYPLLLTTVVLITEMSSMINCISFLPCHSLQVNFPTILKFFLLLIDKYGSRGLLTELKAIVFERDLKIMKIVMF